GGRCPHGLRLAVGVATLLLSTVSPAATGPRYVQKKYLQVTSGNSVSVTLPRPNTAGNLIVAFVVWDNGDPVSASDTNGNAWASAAGPTSAGGTHAQLFYAKNIAAGPTDVVTATFATPVTVRGALYVLEYSGVDRTAPLAGAVVASGSSLTVDSGPLGVA